MLELVNGILEPLKPSPSAGPMGYWIFIGFSYHCASEREGKQWRQYLCSSDISCAIVVEGGLNEMQFPPAEKKKRVRQQRRESVNNGVDHCLSSPFVSPPRSPPRSLLLCSPLSFFSSHLWSFLSGLMLLFLHCVCILA